MKTGQKAQGQTVHGKITNCRHGHGPRRGCRAVEKALETKVRQAGRKACKAEETEVELKRARFRMASTWRC